MKKSKKILIPASFAFLMTGSIFSSVILTSSTQKNKNTISAVDEINDEYLESVRSGVDQMFLNLNNKNSDLSDTKDLLNDKSTIKESQIYHHINPKQENKDAKLSSDVLSFVKTASFDFFNNYLNNAKSFQEKEESLYKYLIDHNIDTSNIKSYNNTYNNFQNKYSENNKFWINNKTFSNGSKTVQQVMDEFFKAGKDSLVVGGVAAVAAAGFWAASWWFGITIPWAVAAATASAAYFAQSAIFYTSGYVLKAFPNYVLSQSLDIVKQLVDYYQAYKVIEHIRSAVNAARTLRGVQLATSWAVPIVNIVAFVLNTILSYTDY